MRLYARDLAGLPLVCLCEISVGPRGNSTNRKPQPRPLMFRASFFILFIYLFICRHSYILRRRIMPSMEMSLRELERLQMQPSRLKKSTYVLKTSSEDAKRVNSARFLRRIIRLLLKCHVYRV